jgi:hypothetical protein
LTALTAISVAACDSTARDTTAGGRGPETSGSAEAPPSPAQAGALGPGGKSACSLPAVFLSRIERGYRPRRSGEIQLVLPPSSFVSGFSHAGPHQKWQHVPLFVYGPGHVAKGKVVRRPVTVADIAPTMARLARYRPEGWDPDGKPLSEALVAPAPQQPPRLIVVVLWDAGGVNVLETWPKSWPVLRGLRPRGTWYSAATVGSSPTWTVPIHATIGTGVFPARHGMVDQNFRYSGGFRDGWELGPKTLLVPAYADLYDGPNGPHGTAPKVGFVGTSAWHLGLIGHGSYPPGSGRDRDLVAIKMSSRPLPSWEAPAPTGNFFAYPAYVEDVGGLAEDARRVDASDGRADGTWRGLRFSELEGGFDSPARIPFQTRVISAIVARDDFGADEVPDILAINYKMLDFVTHKWSMNSLQMKDSLKWTDGGLAQLTGALDRLVGKGRYVVILTADHGSTPDPRLSGAFVVKREVLEAHIQARFGRGVVTRASATQVWLDVERLRRAGHSVDQVVRFLLDYREGDHLSITDHPNRPVFDAVFPSSLLPLHCRA